MTELRSIATDLAAALKRIEPYLDLVPESAARQVREAIAAYEMWKARREIVQEVKCKVCE